MAEDLMGLGKVFEPLATVLADLIQKTLGPAAEQVGKRLAKRVDPNRAIPMLQKVAQTLRDKGIEPKPVSPRLFLYILEEGSLEDDGDLASKWANLLASAASGDSIHVSYPKILAELTPLEANVLDFLYEQVFQSNALLFVRNQELQTKIPISEGQLGISGENLFRLRVCIPMNNANISPPVLFDGISITVLGLNFVRACRGPSRQSPANDI